jgi:hypothetical protein
MIDPPRVVRDEWEERTMRRLAVVAALALMAMLFVTVPAGARPASGPAPAHANVASSHIKHSTKNGTVKVGSKWTIFYKSWSGNEDFCEVFTFAANHDFAGNDVDQGTWSGNLKMTFKMTGYYFPAGATYTAKLQHGGSFNGTFLGSVRANGYSYGPFELVSGPDSSC